MNNSSTYKVLERTLATTNAHIEHDRSGKVEIEWGDSSLSYNAYAQYDEREIVIPDTSISDDEKVKMRHTHLYTPSDLSEELDAMNRYYREHNLGPWKYAFKGPKQDPEPELPVYDINDSIHDIEANYYEENNQKYYKINLGDENTYPQINLLTTTDSKYNINPNAIVDGESTIIEEAGKHAKMIKSVNLNFVVNNGENYHVSGSVKTEDTEYALDTIIPLIAIDENGQPINPTEIDIYTPTEEEVELVQAIENALEKGVVPEGETRFTLSTTSSTYTLNINEGESLTNIVIPGDINKTMKVSGDIKSGTTITYETPGKKTLYLTSESEEPIDITINCNGTVYASGNYDDVVLNGKSFTGTGSNFANVNGNIVIADNITGSATIQANFVGESNAIISNTEQSISITAKNENANINIDCPNSTVTLSGSFDEIEANVAENTLKLPISTHIHKLNLKHGNIFINNGKNIINDLVDEIICDYEYMVDYSKATVLAGSPAACEYTMEQDKVGTITWGAFATGDTVINLNGHNVIASDNSRPAFNIRNKAQVEINGEGTISNDKAYCIWNNSKDATCTINGGHFIGVEHTIYSYAGKVYINGGEFELTGEYDKDTKGHAKFLLNCYDANFNNGTAQIIVKGGRYHNFDPADAYGEPTQPWSYVAEGFKSVCVDEENQIFEVIPK